MNTIITTSEIKDILGISGTDQDAAIAMWNEACTVSLANILGIREFLSHAVTDERVKIFDQRNIIVNDFPIDFTETITIKDSTKTELTGYTFEQENNYLRLIRVLDESGDPTSLGYLSNPYDNRLPEVFISYTAGYEDAGSVPKDIRNLVALMVGGGLAEQNKAGGISELKIDDKTVKFRVNDAPLAEMLISQWTPYLSSTLNILSV